MGFSMENFLYKCELCTTAKLSTWDKDEVWLIDCMVCKSMQFHHKVVLKEGIKFYCQMDKEEEDEHSNTGTDQEK